MLILILKVDFCKFLKYFKVSVVDLDDPEFCQQMEEIFGVSEKSKLNDLPQGMMTHSFIAQSWCAFQAFGAIKYALAMV